MTRAPFYDETADAPTGGSATWLTTDDGVTIRAGYWPHEQPRGTVFFFTGRCEFIEKYGRNASEFARRGLAVVAVDWRGQGLSDRLLKDPNTGHVDKFQDYQRDVRALLAYAEEIDAPKPWFMLGHSMGGAIGLRALIDGHAFKAAAFSAPMWGIVIAPSLRQLSQVLPRVATSLGFGGRYAPTTGGASYLLTAEFEDNQLTTDPEAWAHMQDLARLQPRFQLGGPSLTWLAEALAETRALAAAPRPNVPMHVSVGTEEEIVQIDAIEAMAADWPGATIEVIKGAEHELLMERADVRLPFIDRIVATFGLD